MMWELTASVCHSDARERSRGLDGWARETKRRRWRQWRGNVSGLMMSVEGSRDSCYITPKQPEAPLPLVLIYPESVYLCFGFRWPLSCGPNWGTSSCFDATSCGSTCRCGNHPRLCSHGGSWWSLLQCTRCGKVDHLPLLQLTGWLESQYAFACDSWCRIHCSNE